MPDVQAMLSLLGRINQLQPQDPSTDNDPLEKPVGVYDKTTLGDSYTTSTYTTAALKWGGTGVTAGWIWGTGQYR